MILVYSEMQPHWFLPFKVVVKEIRIQVPLSPGSKEVAEIAGRTYLKPIFEKRYGCDLRFERVEC